MQKNDEISLTIENLSGAGKTVARKEGMVFFVENALPGDTVRARIWKIRKNYAEARAVEVLSASPYRRDPRCRHFGVCGGCSWQNLSYDAQLRFKHQLVVDAFRHIAAVVDPPVHPVIGCENPFFYRNKMEFTFSNERWLTEEEMKQQVATGREVALGLHVPRRYDKILNIEECFLQSELSAAILRSVREIFRIWDLSVYSTKTHQGYLRHLVIREGKRTGEVMVNLVTSSDWPVAIENLTRLLLKQFPEITTLVNNITTRKSLVALGETEKVYHGLGTIREQLGNYTFRISANSFFQTNTLQAEKLYMVARELADLKPRDVLYDLYSGTGTIAILLSDAVERVVGIEVAESAIEDAERNAKENNISNCYFLKKDLGGRSKEGNKWQESHPQPTVILTDPPRSGMHPDVVEEMVRLSPGRIVYVSCNPATQARDVKLLMGSGYRLKLIQPVDMFPHTDHIESVALLARE